MDIAIQSYLYGGMPAAEVANVMLHSWLAEWLRRNVTVAEVQEMLLHATPDPFAVPLPVHGGDRKVCARGLHADSCGAVPRAAGNADGGCS